MFTFPHPSPNETSIPADSPWANFIQEACQAEVTAMNVHNVQQLLMNVSRRLQNPTQLPSRSRGIGALVSLLITMAA